MSQLTVLMVAEKPSLAASIAQLLSHNQHSSRRSALDVHEWTGPFPPLNNAMVKFRMTSVIGHVYSIDFPPEYQSWDRTDPKTLFDAPTIKTEANPKAHVAKHLSLEGKGCDALVLFLDADREGENICFEVMDCVKLNRPTHPALQKQNIYRARFSAISLPEMENAMRHLSSPNQHEAAAVDARQELDLKAGVAFTRFQTRFFQGKYGDLDSSVISYGPCQVPTLHFCVERLQRINTFTPENYWVVQPRVTKAGTRLHLEWERGRVFDQQIAIMLQRRTVADDALLVTHVETREDRKARPHGLNTVELLKTASSFLNIGAAHAMSIAERLYMQGFVSYPRTESSGYPPNFDFESVLETLSRSRDYGDAAVSIRRRDATIVPPRGGTDAGDHPPIHPVRLAEVDEIGGGDAWSMYDYIVRHFLASLSPDCILKKTKVTLTCGGETFFARGSSVVKPGWTSIMPWKSGGSDTTILPSLALQERVEYSEVELVSGKTAPPDYLTESELIGLMESNGIGTDASISTHINNICERNYVRIDPSGRKMIPTELGVTLIRGYQSIDPELCRPAVRSHIEQQINLIAEGKADKGAVVRFALREFAHKYDYFVSHIAKMDALFEATFTSLAQTGKPLSKCGMCSRYLKYVNARPQRLYCPTCEVIYPVPQGGTIKLYKELTCPLDGFQLVMHSMGGSDGKDTVFCPRCFNDPPFEDALRIGTDAPGARRGMSCSTCEHTTCVHAKAARSVAPCPDCEEGTLVLDPISAPKWRLDCNLCSFLLYLPQNLHAVTILTDKACAGCGASLVRCNFKKGHAPPGWDMENETECTVCVTCNERVLALCEAKHGLVRIKRTGGGGGGRGRGGRGRGRWGRGRGRTNPLLSFSDF